jgi:hypothetical protein
MEFTIKDLKLDVLDRGLIQPDRQNAWTAIIVAPNGDWLGVSSYEDEDYWVADCAFRANGFPVFSNGTGTRLTAVRTIAPEIAAELDERVSIAYEEMGTAEAQSAYDCYMDGLNREGEEEMLGRPLFPNEY